MAPDDGMEWERQAFSFGMAPLSNWGGAQMQVFDIDDVVTALAAHGYGITWFEREGSRESSTFAAHSILPTTPGARPRPRNVGNIRGMRRIGKAYGREWKRAPVVAVPLGALPASC